MNNIEVYIVVEGQTEQTFTRDVLAPQMAQLEIYLHPVLIGKPGHKGGNIHFDRAKNDIGNLFKQRKQTYVATMFDFFRIDPNWPGRAEVIQKIKNGVSFTAVQKAAIIESATRDEIVKIFCRYDAQSRFIPYIEMHEFEALLFSDADVLAKKTGINALNIRKILKKYNNPEEINDDPAKTPSKQLATLNHEYRKIADGKIISEAIGIQTIRAQCAHFNNWLIKLENLKPL